jgi:hypothetical protein
MLGTFGIIVIGAIAGILIFAATKPDRVRVERATSIDASSETVFPLIDDFHSWAVWSPWEKVDPDLTRIYSGAERGTGAVYEWQGQKAGEGRMEITDSIPTSRIDIKLDFIKPFEAHNVVKFTLEPAGPATRVTWVMEGPNGFMMKVMSVFVSMDAMIGKDFEAGLANLKATAER